MKPYPWREVSLSCGVLALVACLLVSLFAIVSVIFLAWS
jgi:hypothetical protein